MTGKREAPPRRGLTRAVLLGGCAVWLLCAAPAAAKPSRFDIPSQDLAAALTQFGVQSGREIIYASDILATKRSARVHGELEPQAALSALLSGTGLSYRERNGKIQIVQEGAADPKRAGAELAPTVQTAQAASNATGSTAGRFAEEIVVTANKRAERLHDVPASVSAVTGSTLTAIGAARLEDYTARIPGLVLSNVSFQNGSNQLTIRGITTGVGANPTVGIYIDDSPFGASNGSGGYQIPDLDPSDLSRIEVLRGPQGTLYGAGSMGGLFKYVTAAPDPTRTFGRVEIGGAQVDDGGSAYSVRAALNVPLTEKFAMRVSGYDRTDPGFIRNAQTGETDVNDTHFYGARVALGGAVNDSWNVRLSGILQRDASNGSAVEDHDSNNFQPLYGNWAQRRSPGTGHTNEMFATGDLQIEGDLGWATLTSSSGYNRQHNNINLDVTSAYAPLIASSFGLANGGAAILTERSLVKYTQEVRLSSPATDRLSWLVGGFYTHEKTFLRQQIVPFDARNGLPFGVPLPTVLDAYVYGTFEEVAGFGNVTYHFDPRFDVTLGLRYSHNKQVQLETLAGVLTGAARIPASSSDDSVTYLVTPRYRFNDEWMVYGRIASGYRPGGPNLAVSGVPASYGPDTVVNYEAGVKGDLLNKQLSIDVAAFYIDWSDIQLNQRNPQGLNFFGNAGSARSRGVEASVFWRPVRGLEIDANLVYTLATLAADLPPGSVVAKQGDLLPTTPRWSAHLSADYEFPVWGEWTGLAGASWRYVGDSTGYFATPPTPRYPLPAYDVFDLRAGITNDVWSLNFYVKNVGNTHGQVASYVLGGAERVAVIQPRTFSFALSTKF